MRGESSKSRIVRKNSEVMVNVSFATPMCVPVHWCVYVMNATMALIKVAVLYVVDLGFLMLITVKNVQFKRKIEMVAPRLST